LRIAISAIAWRVRPVALPTCGNTTTLSNVKQLGRHIWFIGEHVETRSGQSSAGHQLGWDYRLLWARNSRHLIGPWLR
jgi:hypothetical protein